MELFEKYTPNTYIERVYQFLRNSIFRVFLNFAVIHTVFLLFKGLRDLKDLFDLLIPTLSIGCLILILNLESYGVDKKKLLFILSELINFNSYLYGLYIDTYQKEIHIITCTATTCGLQLIGNSKFENALIMLKLVVVWWFGPMILGYKEFPTDITAYSTLVFLFTVINTIFTCRKNLEDEHTQSIETIQRMKIQLSNIIQAMSDSILIFSETQEVLLSNLACRQIFLTNNSIAIKEQLTTLKYYQNLDNSELDQNSLYDAILRYLDSETDESITFGINKLNSHSYEWKGTKSEWDEIKIVILTARDITAFIAYEKAKEESKTILLRTVSHEIRTPTNIIVNLSESIIEEHPDYVEIDKIKIINISSKLLLNLINDFLDFSKIVANCFSINKCEVDLRDFIYDTYNLFSIQAEQKQIDYRFYIDTLLPEIIVTDPNRLRQVIVNLLSNSMKFTLRGRIGLEARLTENSTMMIKVIDTGIGIPPHKIDKLFDAFYSTRDSRLNPQGCGLGLFISNKFSQMLGKGPIQVSSKMHEGSEFSFDVDIGIQKKISIESTDEELQEESTCEERLQENLPRNIIIHDSFTPIRAEVLIVDDNEFNLLVMRNYLASAGYNFDVAKTGYEAVEKVRKANASGLYLKVVVMDFQMPGMSGPEASIEIHKLYEDKKIVHLPSIIGYSADESDESTRICEESGMKECLYKSSSKNAFLNLINKYI